MSLYVYGNKHGYFRIIQIHAQKIPTTTYFKVFQLIIYYIFILHAMGQDISTTVNPPPLTLTHCIVDGNIHLGRYYIYKRRRAEQKAGVTSKNNVRKKRKHLNDIKASNKKRKNIARKVKRYKILVRDDDGSLREIQPQDTLWYLLYVNQPPASERLHKQFRNRFRLPYAS